VRACGLCVCVEARGACSVNVELIKDHAQGMFDILDFHTVGIAHCSRMVGFSGGRGVLV
jgi:hypothetical protein